MNNTFGATITQPNQGVALQSYFVSLNKSSPSEHRNRDISTITSLAVQLMLVDSDQHFVLVVANDPIAEQMRKLPTVKTVGAVNIDFDRFRSIVNGDYSRQQKEP